MDEKFKSSLPLLMSAKDIQKCGFSRSMAYNILNRSDLPIVRVAGRKLVQRDDFFKWLDAQKTDC